MYADNVFSAFVGKKIGHDVIEGILESLAYEFLEKTETGAKVAVPSYMIDVYRECDVVEEILRIYGYNNIELPQAMRMSVNAPQKPEPDCVYTALEKLGVSKEEAVFAGDSEVDCITALNAGLDCIGVTWGFRSREVLEEHGARYITDKVDDVYGIV